MEDPFPRWVRESLTAYPLSSSSRKSYFNWIHRFWLFHNKKLLAQMGHEEIHSFLEDLYLNRKVSASTHNQALNALNFFYKRVLNLSQIQKGHLKAPGHRPLILSRQEVRRLLENLQGECQLMASLLYGSGLWLHQCLCLRIHDLCFETPCIKIRDPQGGDSHSSLMPGSLMPALQRQIQKSVIRFEENLLCPRFAGSSLPQPIREKNPRAARQLGWQYLFPAPRLLSEGMNHGMVQHHVPDAFLQKSLKAAIQNAGVDKKASCRSLRHSFAVHLLENGYGIHTVQKLLGHKDISSTMIYTHFLQPNSPGIQSPLDALRQGEGCGETNMGSDR